MKNTIPIIAFFLVLAQLTGQKNPYEQKFSYEIESQLANGEISSSRASLLYSIIGDYISSIQLSEIPISWGMDSVELKNYNLEDAMTQIVQIADKHQIIIISESHSKPQHRIFASKLITELAKKGFKHLGIETLTNNPETGLLLDTMLQQRGYPTNSPFTGTYSHEPQMANLIRSAVKYDYQLFAYERAMDIEGMDRDEIQAINILAYLKNHPEEKLIILCGFHHAIESNINKGRNYNWMAKHLKDKSQIDPLTIYQDNFTEKIVEDEHNFLRKAQIESPSVFVDEQGQIARLSEHVDIEVIHPKTIYYNGRPHWLYQSKDHKSVEINKSDYELDYPILVSAFLKNEREPVPVDRIELKHKYDQKKLVLDKGKYRIEIFDGQNLYTYMEEIE